MSGMEKTNSKASKVPFHRIADFLSCELSAASKVLDYDNNSPPNYAAGVVREMFVTGVNFLLAREDYEPGQPFPELINSVMYSPHEKKKWVADRITPNAPAAIQQARKMIKAAVEDNDIWGFFKQISKGTEVDYEIPESIIGLPHWVKRCGDPIVIIHVCQTPANDFRKVRAEQKNLEFFAVEMFKTSPTLVKVKMILLHIPRVDCTTPQPAAKKYLQNIENAPDHIVRFIPNIQAKIGQAAASETKLHSVFTTNPFSHYCRLCTLRKRGECPEFSQQENS